MEIITSIVVQALLVGLSLAVTVLRCWLRVYKEHRKLTLPDYLVWGGWFCAVGWVACSIKALYLQVDHPLAEDTTSDSVEYLKTVFLSCYFFDTGLYFPKASLIAFYWWLIPMGFRRLRIAVYVGTAFLIAAFFASILTNTLIAPSISDNWSIENQLNSTWNTYADLVVNWVLNFATDLLLFGLPFFIINCLKLRRRQKIGLVGVFSLGIITMAISLARFIVYNADYDIDDASGNAWCTAELCTAIIVVSLPALKPLIMRSTPTNTTNRSTNGYVKTGSAKAFDSHGGGSSRVHIHGGKVDDEFELTFLDRKISPTPTGTTTGTTAETGTSDAKDSVMVTTDITTTRDVV